MNPLPRRTFLGLGLGFVAAGSNLNAAPAAGAPPAGEAPTGKEELFKIKKVEIATQKAPDFTLKGGTTDKRWKAKDWIEMDFEIDVKPPKADRDLKFYDTISIKYYAFLIPTDPKKQKVLTVEVNYVNIPVDEVIHTVVYLSNSTIVNITGDKNVDKGLIKFYGAEVTYKGILAGQYASSKIGNLPWWKSDKTPALEEGRLLPKGKTPFAPLWFDHYMEEKYEGGAK